MKKIRGEEGTRSKWEERGPSHSFMEIKDVISVPVRTSFKLTRFLLSTLSFEACSWPRGSPFFIEHSRRFDAANCKLISLLSFSQLDFF